MFKFLNFETKNINFAVLILGVCSFISALLGFIRDRLLAGKFGLGKELDIYYASFKIPDFISMTLIVGALGSAILPIFSEKLVKSKKSAFWYLSNLLNLFLFFLILISTILFFLTPKLIFFVAPGFFGEKKEMTILLTRILLLSPIILGISTILSGVLRIFNRFLITALSPILYNLGIIFGILFFLPYFGLPGLAFGVIFGCLLHLLIQLPILIKLGFRPKKVFNIFDKDFIETIKLMIPRVLGLGANQVNLIIINALASKLGSGSISALNLSENFVRPILTFFGASFSSASFPFLSLNFAKRDFKNFKKLFFSVFKKTLIFILPISFSFFIFRNLIVEIVLKTGKFDLADVQLTGACLGMFSLGIFAQSLNLLFAKGFYAQKDSKTPALINILGTVLNLIFCLFFIWLLSFSNPFKNFITSVLNLKDLKNFKVIALPLSFSLSCIFQFFCFFVIFSRKIKFIKNLNPPFNNEKISQVDNNKKNNYYN